jgi:metal-responsive CopG/Arc/MetJ family transcriptional regulator
MKTIAITIDEATLGRVDRLVSGGDPRSRNRSRIIREAVQDYLSRMERANEEERERAIYRKHRARIARQATVLVREQAKP